MLELLIVGFVALVTGGVVGLKVVAPRTKSQADDRVLALLEKYGVPLAEFLAAQKAAKSVLPRPKVVDHRTN